MKFSDLISSDKYKPRPRVDVEGADRDKAFQRLTLNAYKDFDAALKAGKFQVSPDERSYISQQELVEKAGGKWLGKRESFLEDFDLNMDDTATKNFIRDYFKGKRSYGEARTPKVVKNIKNEKLRDDAKEAIERVFKLQDVHGKKHMLEEIDNLKKSLKAYAEVLRPLKGILPD